MKHLIQPAVAKDDGALCRSPARRRREPPLREDSKGNGEFDVEMANNEVDRGLLGNAALDRLVGCFAKGQRECSPDRLRQRRLKDGDCSTVQRWARITGL